jgi:hypothetical protein
MRRLGATGGEQPRAGDRSASDRVYLATVRGIAYELERSLAETNPGLKSYLRQQLADELERLARALRESDPTADE